MIKQHVPQQAPKSIGKTLLASVATSLKIANLIKLFTYKNSYLIDQGWIRSNKEAKSVGKDGEDLPWLTYPFINFIEPRLKETFLMFEYGSGSSTIWFAKHVDKVYSVEHDREWYNKISKNKPANVELTLREVDVKGDYSAITYMSLADESSYSSEIKNTNKLYDIILIDGIFRANSIVNSVNSVKETGVIIVDNVDYVESQESVDYLHSLGYRSIYFWGMCPIVHHDSCTAIFYRDFNCLNI
ncbi:hypothetical protein GCM10028818_14390 [Spirosoma horti]